MLRKRSASAVLIVVLSFEPAQKGLAFGRVRSQYSHESLEGASRGCIAVLGEGNYKIADHAKQNLSGVR